MKVWRKFTAVALVFVMALALSATALADPPAPAELTDGEVGGYEAADTQNLDNKKINIQKEITVYNPDEPFVYGPSIVYNYAIAAGAAGDMATVTDTADDHSTSQPVTITTVPGEGVANISLSGPAVGDTGKITWTNADILKASATGTANIKNLTVDFSSVVFPNPGVYRYKITETVTYTNTGVTATTNTAGHDRFLDVYVKRSSTYTPVSDGHTNTASDWQIYGYVCVPDKDAINESTADKTCGYVNSATEGSNADVYKTYNLTIKKVLTGETGAMSSWKFPFDVDFVNTNATGNFQLSAKVTGNAVSGASDNSTGTAVTGDSVAAAALPTAGSAGALTAFDPSASLKIPDGGTVKYIGIPEGTTYTVTETNDVTGTTYIASVKEGSGATDAAAVTAAADVTLDSANSTNAVMATGNTSASINTSAKAAYTKSSAVATGNNAYVEFTNKLALISPTGVTLRYAPYMAMLGAGVVALPLSIRRKREDF